MFLQNGDTLALLQDCHSSFFCKKKSFGSAHVEEEILMIKNCKDSLKKLGRLALYRDFKTFLMAIFGQGGHRNRYRSFLSRSL